MNELELTMTLSEFGVNVPDRCKSCPRLGALASQLSQAKDQRDYIVIGTEPDVLFANMRSQLAKGIKERYPAATDEQVAYTVENSISKYLEDPSRLAVVLRQAGENLAMQDEVVEMTLGLITDLLSDCPPEGCTAGE